MVRGQTIDQVIHSHTLVFVIHFFFLSLPRPGNNLLSINYLWRKTRTSFYLMVSQYGQKKTWGLCKHCTVHSGLSWTLQHPCLIVSTSWRQDLSSGTGGWAKNRRGWQRKVQTYWRDVAVQRLLAGWHAHRVRAFIYTFEADCWAAITGCRVRSGGIFITCDPIFTSPLNPIKIHVQVLSK